MRSATAGDEIPTEAAIWVLEILALDCSAANILVCMVSSFIFKIIN
jgi:hypothetical protein